MRNPTSNTAFTFACAAIGPGGRRARFVTAFTVDCRFAGAGATGVNATEGCPEITSHISCLGFVAGPGTVVLGRARCGTRTGKTAARSDTECFQRHPPLGGYDGRQRREEADERTIARAARLLFRFSRPRELSRAGAGRAHGTLSERQVPRPKARPDHGAGPELPAIHHHVS